MAENEAGHEPSKRRSDVLDAIFDVVDDHAEEEAAPRSTVFRAQALEQIDVPKQLDNLLPLTSRRRWLAVVGAAVLVLAGLAYAAGTVTITSVTGTGRAVPAPGLAAAARAASAVVTQVSVAPGTAVTAGEIILVATSTTGQTIPVASPIDGTVWQELAPIGAVVNPGDTVATILPLAKGPEAMFAVEESLAGPLRVGQEVTLGTADGATVQGSISAIAVAPIPAANASARLSLPLPAGAPMVMITVTPAAALPPGAELTAEFIISKQTLAARLLAGG